MSNSISKRGPIELFILKKSAVQLRAMRTLLVTIGARIEGALKCGCCGAHFLTIRFDYLSAKCNSFFSSAELFYNVLYTMYLIHHIPSFCWKHNFLDLQPWTKFFVCFGAMSFEKKPTFEEIFCSSSQPTQSSKDRWVKYRNIFNTNYRFKKIMICCTYNW